MKTVLNKTEKETKNIFYCEKIQNFMFSFDNSLKSKKINFTMKNVVLLATKTHTLHDLFLMVCFYYHSLNFMQMHINECMYIGFI